MKNMTCEGFLKKYIEKLPLLHQSRMRQSRPEGITLQLILDHESDMIFWKYPESDSGLLMCYDEEFYIYDRENADRVKVSPKITLAQAYELSLNFADGRWIVGEPAADRFKEKITQWFFDDGSVLVHSTVHGVGTCHEDDNLWAELDNKKEE